MAKSKADLLSDHDIYVRHVALARDAQNQGEFINALDQAETALPHLDGAVACDRKHFGNDATRSDAVDLILQLAPFVFAIDRLDRLDQFVKKQKRNVRSTLDDFDNRLATARRLTWKAREVWALLESRGRTSEHDICIELHLHAHEWQEILRAWTQVGVLHVIDDASRDTVSLTSSLDTSWRAKCANCGAIAKAIKAKFLEPQTCPKCHAVSWFVLVGCVAQD